MRKYTASEDMFRAVSIILFLDYDGTLVPIAQTPQKAVLPMAVKRTLAGLSRLKDVKVVVISGRSLKDVRRMVGLNNIIYAGNHGLEMRGAGVVFEHPTSSASRKAIDTICSSLRSELSALKGVLIEDKGKTLSVHYRLAGKKDANKIREMIEKAVSPFVKRALIKVTEGKKVVEIRPPVYWDKGKAVTWLLKKLKKDAGRPILPIYIGDDKTDEDAFGVLRNRGLTFYVGSKGVSNAQYRIKDTKEVHGFLKALFNIKKEKQWEK
ncbi:MAG: trehalose-phosphatase [Candidatus Margulisiibacteriota bacterium]